MKKGRSRRREPPCPSLRCRHGDTGRHLDGCLSAVSVVPAAPQMFAFIWRHRIIVPVTSSGAVRFAPLRFSLRDAAAFHRDSFPCDGEAAFQAACLGCPFAGPSAPFGWESHSIHRSGSDVVPTRTSSTALPRGWEHPRDVCASRRVVSPLEPLASIRSFVRVPAVESRHQLLFGAMCPVQPKPSICITNAFEPPDPSVSGPSAPEFLRSLADLPSSAELILVCPSRLPKMTTPSSPPTPRTPGRDLRVCVAIRLRCSRCLRIPSSRQRCHPPLVCSHSVFNEHPRER